MKTKEFRAGLPGNKFRSVRAVLLLTFAALLVLGGMVVRAGAARRGFDGRGNEDRQDGDEREDQREPHAIGLWGDLPYSDVQALTGVPIMIAVMNSQDLAFTAHDGDLKAGNSIKGSVTATDCSDALYIQGLNYFNSLEAPAVFTTGDNDWTDCDRASNGGFNSRERLDHERQLFFSTPYTLGKHHLRQKVQNDALCLDAKSNKVPCLENRRWALHGVTYIESCQLHSSTSNPRGRRGHGRPCPRPAPAVPPRP